MKAREPRIDLLERFRLREAAERLCAAGLAVAVSLVIRPPRDVPAAIWRLAIGLTLIFLLGPDVRFGYFIYPFGLLGWLLLTKVAEPSRAEEPADPVNGSVQRVVGDS